MTKEPRRNEIDERLLALALKTLVDQLPFDVWVRDKDDTMVFLNTALRERWGAGVGGRTVATSAVRPEVAEKWRTTNARALAGETVKDEVTYDIQGVPQTIIGVVTAFRDDEGVRGTVGINVDVTGERRARAEAHRLGRLLRDAFNSAPVPMGILAVRGDGDLVHVEDNPSAAAVIGGAPDDLRGKTERELGVPADATVRLIARFREARATRRPVAIELAYASFEGPVRTLEGKAIAVDDPGEERYAYVATDVSELRNLQSGIIRADRLASLGILSASIGHEIGTSAAVALGGLEVSMKMVERGAAPDEVLATLRESQRALLRGVGVLRDMRALAVGATLGSETCAIGAALDTIKEVLRSDLALHATLREAPSPLAGEVLVSHSRLVQILLNLVRNAIDAFGAGRGTIWVEVTRRSEDRLQIDVADDGPGLPEAVRERLFEPFVSTKAEGTGLGLYVCKLLATLSGGSIEASEREGGGLRVRVVLPAAT